MFIHNYLSDVFTVYGRDCNAQTTSMQRFEFLKHFQLKGFKENQYPLLTSAKCQSQDERRGLTQAFSDPSI